MADRKESKAPKFFEFPHGELIRTILLQRGDKSIPTLNGVTNDGILTIRTAIFNTENNAPILLKDGDQYTCTVSHLKLVFQEIRTRIIEGEMAQVEIFRRTN